MTDQPSREGPWTICRKCANEGACNPCDPVEVVPASTLQAAEAERDSAKRELARIQEAECCCVPTEEGSVWHRDCPLHGADAHRRALAAEAREDALREGIKQVVERNEIGVHSRDIGDELYSLLSTQEPTR